MANTILRWAFIGVGGGGCNILRDTLMFSKYVRDGVKDALFFDTSITTKVRIAKDRIPESINTRVYEYGSTQGAMINPKLGEQYMEKFLGERDGEGTVLDTLYDMLDEVDSVCIFFTLGGGTGGGGAPLLAQKILERGRQVILVGVLTDVFGGELHVANTIPNIGRVMELLRVNRDSTALILLDNETLRNITNGTFPKINEYIARMIDYLFSTSVVAKEQTGKTMDVSDMISLIRDRGGAVATLSGSMNYMKENTGKEKPALTIERIFETPILRNFSVCFDDIKKGLTNVKVSYLGCESEYRILEEYVGEFIIRKLDYSPIQIYPSFTRGDELVTVALIPNIVLTDVLRNCYELSLKMSRLRDTAYAFSEEEVKKYWRILEVHDKLLTDNMKLWMEMTQ
ncbi:MAG: hypothetical protein U9Q22_04035 [Candidatus Altiarchaeota archaeon]|nr:hypothetical protein [Candidatus Altiarchaeota archaeon]